MVAALKQPPCQSLAAALRQPPCRSRRVPEEDGRVVAPPLQMSIVSCREDVDRDEDEQNVEVRDEFCSRSSKNC